MDYKEAIVNALESGVYPFIDYAIKDEKDKRKLLIRKSHIYKKQLDNLITIAEQLAGDIDSDYLAGKLEAYRTAKKVFEEIVLIILRSENDA